MSDELEQLPFEEAFSELETAVERLEKGELTLEEAIALYERGMSLARRCSDALDTAELQVQQLGLSEGNRQLGLFEENAAG